MMPSAVSAQDKEAELTWEEHHARCAWWDAHTRMIIEYGELAREGDITQEERALLRTVESDMRLVTDQHCQGMEDRRGYLPQRSVERTVCDLLMSGFHDFTLKWRLIPFESVWERAELGRIHTLVIAQKICTSDRNSEYFELLQTIREMTIKYAVCSGVNIRVQPSTEARIAFTAPGGMGIPVISEAYGENWQGSNLWYQLPDSTGYVHSNLLLEEEPQCR